MSITIEEAKIEVARLRKERKEIIDQFGDRGQLHPMNVAIGGLNPAAQRLYIVRSEIAVLEGKIRDMQGKTLPVLQEIPGTKNRYGLKYDIFHGFRVGKLGTDNFGKWYVVEDGKLIAENLTSIAEAKKAFVRSGKK